MSIFYYNQIIFFLLKINLYVYDSLLKLFITVLIRLFSIIYPVHNFVHNFSSIYLYCS
nr:MAG TPA_asm: hypothetical protein [Microviridae sp.]